jgi:hypothetical protein
VGTLSIPQDYDPNTAKQIRVLTAGDQDAQGAVTVTVTDPVHSVTVTASLEVQVVATQRLASVTVYPDRVSLRPNQAKALTAQALDELGDPIDVKFEWTLVGDLGSLKEPADDEWGSRQEDPTDDPEGTGGDGTDPGGDGTDPGGDVVIAPPPEPSDDASTSTRFFVSDDRTGSGEIVVTATDAQGNTAEARVAVEVRG